MNHRFLLTYLYQNIHILFCLLCVPLSPRWKTLCLTKEPSSRYFHSISMLNLDFSSVGHIKEYDLDQF